MKIRNNEHGSALLMVLLLVLVFTILGMGLLSMNISATKQFNKKEEQVQARHLAEMGVLHYKAEINRKVEEHNNLINGYNNSSINKEKLEEKINSQKILFCSDLAKNSTINEVKYTVKLTERPNCSDNIILTINSIGVVRSSSEIIDAEFTITIPPDAVEVIGGDGEGSVISGNGTLPIPLKDEEVVTSWPCVKHCGYKKINGFVDVDVVGMQKGDITVNNHLVAKDVNITNGNSVNLTIAGDFYVKNNFYAGTQNCFAIQGDFTVKNQIHMKNKTYIFIYGNAYLPSSISQQGNPKIFVLGDVYIDGVKRDNPKPYSDFDKESKQSNGCSLPGTGITGNNPPNQLIINRWGMWKEIKATYR